MDKLLNEPVRRSRNPVEDIIFSPPNKPDRTTHRQNNIFLEQGQTNLQTGQRRGHNKTISDTVAMATYTRDKDGAGRRLDKTCVNGQEKYSETEPAKAPDEAQTRLDKTGDEENEEEATANEEGDKKNGQRSPDSQRR